VFAPVNLDGARVAELDRNDPRSRIGAEEERIFLESHGPATTRRKRGESSVGVTRAFFLVLVLVLVIVIVIECSTQESITSMSTSTITNSC
jgi:hypothetical protein